MKGSDQQWMTHLYTGEIKERWRQRPSGMYLYEPLHRPGSTLPLTSSCNQLRERLCTDPNMPLHPPLYCAICSAPCLPSEAKVVEENGITQAKSLTLHLSPEGQAARLPPAVGLPVAQKPDHSPILAPDTTHPSQSSSNCLSDTNANHRAEWQTNWHVLKTATGIVPPPIISVSSAHLSLANEELEESHQRCVPIHDWCLEKVRRVVGRKTVGVGLSVETSLMLGWSIPRWTGLGPWVRREGEMLLEEVGESGMTGYWRGTEDQRGRFEPGKEGSHLLPVSFDL
jgi:hypothetical protein